jgi:o-succinylbenzoate synthase
MERSHDPASAWSSLGDRTAISLDAIEIRWVELQLRNPVRTSRGVHDRRPVILLRLIGTDPNGAVEGWGECAALADTTYDAEDATTSFATLEQILCPALLSVTGSAGRMPSMGEFAALRTDVAATSLAGAALEMAVADTHLRSEGTSFAELCSVGSDPVPVGAVVGECRDATELVNRVDRLVDGGYQRIKMKIGRGSDVEPIAAVRRAHPGLFLQVDANEDYTESDIDHLAGFDRFELACLEQPFRRDDLSGHAHLAQRMATPICLDESLHSVDMVVSALEMEACSVVCLKPARLGGIGPALEVIRVCSAASVPLWIGGMFETGFARAVNVVVGAVSGSPWPGDLSPAHSYLREDLTAQTAQVAGPLTVVPSRTPGMGPALDQVMVDRHTVNMVRLESIPGSHFGDG